MLASISASIALRSRLIPPSAHSIWQSPRPISGSPRMTSPPFEALFVNDRIHLGLQRLDILLSDADDEMRRLAQRSQAF